MESVELGNMTRLEECPECGYEMMRVDAHEMSATCENCKRIMQDVRLLLSFAPSKRAAYRRLSGDDEDEGDEWYQEIDLDEVSEEVRSTRETVDGARFIAAFRRLVESLDDEGVRSVYMAMTGNSGEIYCPFSGLPGEVMERLEKDEGYKEYTSVYHLIFNLVTAMYHEALEVEFERYLRREGKEDLIGDEGG